MVFYETASLAVEVLLYLKAISPTTERLCSKQCGSAACTWVYHDISRVGENLNEIPKERNGLLSGMDGRRFCVAHPIYAVEHHTTSNGIIVELRQLVAIKQDSIFAVTDNLHVCLQNLC